MQNIYSAVPIKSHPFAPSELKIGKHPLIWTLCYRFSNLLKLLRLICRFLVHIFAPGFDCELKIPRNLNFNRYTWWWKHEYTPSLGAMNFFRPPPCKNLIRRCLQASVGLLSYYNPTIGTADYVISTPKWTKKAWCNRRINFLTKAQSALLQRSMDNIGSLNVAKCFSTLCKSEHSR